MGTGTRSGRRHRVGAALLAGIAATPLHAQDSGGDPPVASAPAPSTPPTAAPPPTAAEGFARRGPFSFTGAETADVIGNAAGGLRRGLKFLTKTALSAGYDGAQDGHEGLSGLLSAQYVAGGHISGAGVGDLQTLDNIEAFGALRVYEAWLSRDYDNRRGWKAGLDRPQRRLRHAGGRRAVPQQLRRHRSRPVEVGAQRPVDLPDDGARRDRLPSGRGRA